jgi:GlpG protein
MRLIGHLASESTARTFGDYLFVQGIENHLEHENDSGWAVWISDEDKLERASSLLAAFRTNPAAPEYKAKAKSAAELRAELEKGETAYRKRVRGRGQLFRPLTAYGFGLLTFALIVLSVAVFILTKSGDEPQRLGFSITNYSVSGDMVTWYRGLPEIRHGQIWRLITPIFIHFGILHIFLNMLWLRDLGSMIEGRQSTWHLAALVLVIAALSNLAQYLVHGPTFGGMSGVVYGLFGYIWIRGKRDPASGLFLHPTTVMMMLIWLVVCFTGLAGPIANVVHAVGLILGVAWGFLSSLRHR